MFNFTDTKNATEYIYVKVISQKCNTKCKLILKPKKAGPLLTEELKQKQLLFCTKVYVSADLQKCTKLPACPHSDTEYTWYILKFLKSQESSC